MIYLLRTAGINTDHKAVLVLKIGYTDDLRGDGRFQDYKNAGMDIEILHTISGGNTYLEHELQRKFQNHRLSWKSLEWFEDCEEILDAFSGFSNIDDVSALLGYVNFEEFENRRLKISEKELYLESLGTVINNFGEDSSISNFYRDFISESRFPKRLESLCKFDEYEKLIDYIPDSTFSQFIEVLGPDRCAAFSYRKNLLKKELKTYINIHSVDVRPMILEKFCIGSKYTLNSIKQELGNIYESVGYSKTPKAVDLLDYFEIQETSFCTTVDGKKHKTRAYKILSIK